MSSTEQKTPKSLSTPEEYGKILDGYDTWLFDCDGVLWSGDDLIEGSKEVINRLRKSGKRVIFVTNNASKSRKAIKKKFDQLGYEAKEEDIVSSSFAASIYLRDVLKFPKDRKVYVIGMHGIEEELDEAGILHCGGTNPEDNQFLPPNDFSSLRNEQAIDPSVGAVMCGFDMHLNYTKLCKAFKHITRKGAEGPVVEGERGGGCHFILTNDDSTFPAGGGPWPGAGSLSAPLLFSSGRKPIIVGKPNQPMLDTIKEHYHIDEKRTIFVGDRLNTDIAFANNGNIDSLLVLTGISTEEDIKKENIYPTYIMESLGCLNEAK
ncbi:hypothetical protein L7F22_019500 [Adiantum nelumboides]|nr:hypothetical protein [Adiantum nelumboides]